MVAKYSRRCFALVEKIDEQIKQGKTTITRSKELSQALFLTLYGRSEAEKYSILEKLANQEIKVSEIKKVSGQNFLFCFYFLYFYFKKGLGRQNMRSIFLSPFPLPSDPKKKPHYNIVRYYLVSAMLSSGSASVLGVYGTFGFCLVVLNYFKFCIILLFQIGMRGKKTKGI